MNEVNPDQRRAKVYALLVFSVALAVRLGYLASLETSPYYDVRYLKGADNYDYVVAALKIAEGDLIGQGQFNRSPLYEYFLALIFKLGGGNLLWPRLVQLTLGAVTAVLAFFFGQRLAGPVAGLLAGLITALYGPLFFYEAAFLRDALLALLYSGFALCLARARKRPGFWTGSAVGTLFMLSYLGRPNIAIMVLILPWWLVQAWRKSESVEEREPLAEEKGLSSPRTRLAARKIAWFGLGVFLGLAVVMTPLALRNRAAGVPIFSTTQRGALEFIAGNHPTVRAAGWDLSPEVIALDQKCQGRLSCAIFAILRLYQNRPFQLVKRQFTKTWLFLWGYEIPSNQNYYVEQRYVAYMNHPWLAWPCLISFGLIGLWLLRKKLGAELELFSYTILISLGTIAFYVADRFRLAVVPGLAAFAGAGLVEIMRRARRRDWLSAGVPLAIALGIMLAVWPRLPDRLGPNDYYNLVRYHLMRNQDERARAWCEEGIAQAEKIVREKGDAESHYRLARLFFLAGRPLPEVQAELSRAQTPPLPPWLVPLLQSMQEVIEVRKKEGDPLLRGFRL